MKPRKIILKLPSEPQVIGKMPDGQPIWLDPKELELSGEQKDELGQNRANYIVLATARKLAEVVLENASRFVEQTVMNILPSGIDSEAKVFQWTMENGITIEQDGFTTIVKRQGRVLRIMTAKVDKRFSGMVEKLLREQMASPQQNN